MVTCPPLSQTPGACGWYTPNQLQEAMENLGYAGNLAGYIADQQNLWNNGAYPGGPTYCQEWQNEQLACINAASNGTVSQYNLNPITLNQSNCAQLGGVSDANGNCTFPSNGTNTIPAITGAVSGNTTASTSVVAQTNTPTNTTNTGISTSALTEDSLGLGLPNWGYAAIAVGILVLMEMGKK
jgi:hypothetical protein